MKKFGYSKKTSKCTREIKLERPILTSTSPLLLFRPMEIRGCRIVYSNSLPSNRAIAVPLLSGLHTTRDGLDGADLSANNARASLSVERWVPDMLLFSAHQNGSSWKGKHLPRTCVYIKPVSHNAPRLRRWRVYFVRGRPATYFTLFYLVPDTYFMSGSVSI